MASHTCLADDAGYWLGNLVFLYMASYPPEAVSTQPLEQKSQGFQESKNKGSYRDFQGLEPKVRDDPLSHLLLVKASHRPAQVQEEGNDSAS